MIQQDWGPLKMFPKILDIYTYIFFTDSDRLLKLSFGKAFESLGPEVSATSKYNFTFQ